MEEALQAALCIDTIRADIDMMIFGTGKFSKINMKPSKFGQGILSIFHSGPFNHPQNFVNTINWFGYFSIPA